MSSGGDNATDIATGYQYQKNNVRDASDWIALKKQVRVRNDPNLKTSTDPWFVGGNDMRLTYQQGSFKQNALGCGTCVGSAFSGNGIP